MSDRSRDTGEAPVAPPAPNTARANGSRSLASACASWSPSLAPDGDRIAYVCDRDDVPRVWVRNLADGQERALDTGPDPVQLVRWSIDGEWLAVLAAPGGSPRTQVWAVRPDGRDLRRVAKTALGATYLGPWTHQPHIVAIARTTDAEAEGSAELENVVTGERTFVAEGGQPILLDLDRDTRVALVRRGPRGIRSVWLVELDTGREEQLVPSERPGSTDVGRLAPDSRMAYVLSDAGGEMRGLFAVTFATETTVQSTRLVAERAEAELDDLILSADGRTALLFWNLAGRSECELMDVATEQRSALELPEPVAHEASFSLDGRWLAITLEGPTQPRAVWLFDRRNAAWKRLTSQAPDWPSPAVHPTLEFVRTSDGLQVTGWLYRPPEHVGSRGAAVIHLHGGPEAQERPTFNPLFQELAAHGILVFAPNVRGSSGFGRSFVHADDRDKRWNAMADVAACAHFLIDRGLASPHRLACAGRSYGGYLTLAMLVFHPEVFAAGVDVCGMADFHTFYAHTEPWIAEAAYPKYGHPAHDAALLRALSPLHRFDALRAPLLVVHGAHDSNVPVYEAEQVVAAARARNVPVEYLLFPDEGHELLRLHNREHFVRTTVDWLLRQLDR